MLLRSVKDVDVYQKTILLRVDLNIESAGQERAPWEETKLRSFFATLAYLLKQRAKIILLSHRGRPHGRDPACSLYPQFERLKTIFEQEKFHSLIDRFSFVEKPLLFRKDSFAERQIVLFENLRFMRGEMLADRTFASALASMADLYVNDAFSVCHDAHASVCVLPALLPSAAGFALQKEVETLSEILKRPKRPLTVVLGGGKADTKLKLVEKFILRADYLFVGGALGNTFLKAAGYEIGNSWYEKKLISAAQKFTTTPRKSFLTPDDFTEPFLVDFAFFQGKRLKYLKKRVLTSPRVHTGRVQGDQVRLVDYLCADPFPAEQSILDIDLTTSRFLRYLIRRSKQILWNGPLGYFEHPRFAAGTKQWVEDLEQERSRVILGGGETLAAYYAFGGTKRRNVFLSTGGGALLEFFINPALPGLLPLMKRR